MTIKKRLFWSNLLMILVPIIVTAIIGLLCAGFIWISMTLGIGLSLQDPQDFTYASMAVTESVEHKLEKGGDLESLKSLFDRNGMRLIVTCGKDTIFSYGKEEPEDNKLMAVVESLEGEITIAHKGRCLFLTHHRHEGRDYVISLFGGSGSGQGYYDLRAALAVSLLLVALAVLCSILLTNRFLTKFVFKRIEDPIDILTHGVREIRDGNLEYHIDYDRNDEFLHVCNDFNEMARRLRESTELIEKQQQSRKELLAGISHDIRSPLTSIQAYVEGLLDGVAKTKADQKRYLHTIKTKAEDLDRMVSQLFLFSKMELGEYPHNPRELQLDEMIRQMAAEIKGEYEEHGMTIHTELEPAVIYADPVQIHRIIRNILENSMKYKEKDQGRIAILLARRGDRWRLSIADDGPGVPEEALSHLFEVFYRSDPSRKNPNQGSGLGLAIVSNAVQQLGGSVAAKKAAQGGLEIEIFFPDCEVSKNGEDIDSGR